MPRTSDPATRGRRARISREKFVQAGVAVVRRNEADRRPRSLKELLVLPLKDVLAEVSADESTPVTAPLLYTHWDDYDDFLDDVLATLYNPSEKLPPGPLATGEGPVEGRLADHASSDLAQAGEEAATYFGMFAGVGSPRIAELLGRIYDRYDEAIVPALRAALAEAGRRVRPDLGDEDGGVRQLARALTATTEGLTLRGVVQPNDADRLLVRESAVALYRQFTEPITEP